MAVETPTPVVEAQPNGQAPATPPAVAPNTETPAEQTVPYARFKEINDQLKALKDESAQRATAQEAEDNRKLAEQAEWQKLADKRQTKVEELTPKAELADKLTEVVTAQYAAEIAAWPQEVKDMAPDDSADILQKLAWMNKAKPLALGLLKDKPPVPGNGGRPKPTGAAGVAKQDEATRAHYSKRYARYR